MPAPKTSRSARETPRPARGRPPKYGQPAKVVAVTLPTDTIEALQRIHADLGWAIVSLVDAARGMAGRTPRPRTAELVEIGSGHSLIVIPAIGVRRVPGVQMVPLTEGQAFLALEPGRGMADLELAVTDLLEEARLSTRDRETLTSLASQLRRWRRDRRLAFTTRTIIVASRTES
jgi:hypothetical protein